MRNIALIVFLAMTTAACVDSDDQTEDVEVVVVEEHFDLGGYQVSTVFAPDAEPVVLDGGMCACETEECADQWVMDNLGCNLCIVVHCANGDSQHACVECPETTPSVEASTDLAALSL